ncbi:hypothetical protein D3C74_431380 [compost metagenome]
MFVCFFHLQAKSNILIHRHVLEQRIVLEHKADLPLLGRKIIYRLAMKNNLAAVRRLQSCQHAQNRGFAPAAWTEQPNQMAFGNAEVDVLHRVKISEMLIESPDLYMHINALPFFFCSIP